jgi:hypothetical protein
MALAKFRSAGAALVDTLDGRVCNHRRILTGHSTMAQGVSTSDARAYSITGAVAIIFGVVLSAYVSRMLAALDRVY